MKKTLAAVAVLGAFAGSALAADVTLYGKVDLGLQYKNTNSDVITENGVIENQKEDSFGMRSGNSSTSRWGIKGTEQISDGLTVGFQLEGGFTADDGKSDNDTTLFGRESRLYVQTDFGEFGFGRFGTLTSGNGSYDIFGGDAAVFGTGWAETIGADGAIFRAKGGRMDNAITYVSPEFAGVQVYAQASLGTDSDADGQEGSSDVDRYYAIGATGNWGALSGALVFSTTDYNRPWANAVGTDGHSQSDVVDRQGREDMSKVVSGYVAYDFGVVKTTLGAQYYDDFVGSAWTAFDDGYTAFDELADYSTKGYGVMLGATAPVAGGTFYASLGYADYETTEEVGTDKVEVDGYQVGLGYMYPLSKRTSVYGGVGYTKMSADHGHVSADDQTTEAVIGMVHNF